MSDVTVFENEVSVPADLSTSALVFDFSMIENMNKLAELMAKSKVAVPHHFQGSPGDCLAVVMQSAQWGMNPFAVAQKTFLISGKLGYEAQLVNAVINAKAPVTGRIEYEWFGDWSRVIGNTVELQGKNGTYRKLASKPDDEKGCGVRVWATFKGEDKPRVLELLLTQAMTRNSTLWAEDPRQQLAYLAVKRWSRLYCPDVVMGVYTPDELEERPTEKYMGSIDGDSGETRQSPKLPGSKKEKEQKLQEADKPVDAEDSVSQTDRAAPNPPQNVTAQEDTGEVASIGEKRHIEAKLKQAGIALDVAMEACGITSFEALTRDGFVSMRDYIRNQTA